MKKIVAVGVVTGVVVFAFFRNFSKKVNRTLAERREDKLVPEVW
ncbi:hypothetical protein [Dyadobacter sp. CY312]|nr:hypothetical protein [Dyadobacter sp. CY312]